MIVIDEQLLARFRRFPRCEVCGKPNTVGLDPAHLMSRGAGRVDHPWNLCAVCRECHQAAHQSPQYAAKLWIAVCRRERTTAKRIQMVVWGIRRAKPEASVTRE